MKNPVATTRQFLTETVVELKRSAWPTRKELIDSTMIIILAMVVLGLFVALADFIFLKIVGALTGSA